MVCGFLSGGGFLSGSGSGYISVIVVGTSVVEGYLSSSGSWFVSVTGYLSGCEYLSG